MAARLPPHEYCCLMFMFDNFYKFLLQPFCQAHLPNLGAPCKILSLGKGYMDMMPGCFYRGGHLGSHAGKFCACKSSVLGISIRDADQTVVRAPSRLDGSCLVEMSIERRPYSPNACVRRLFQINCIWGKLWISHARSFRPFLFCPIDFALFKLRPF